MAHRGRAGGDVARQVAVVAAVVGGVVSGATGDYGEASESPSPVLPADGAFAVWAPVYAGVIAHAVHQARPSARTDPLLRRTGWPLAAAIGLSGLWVRVQQPPVAQLPLVAATTAAAVTALVRAEPGSDRPRTTAATGHSGSVADALLVRAPVGLLAGWLTLATTAATTEVALASGLRTSPRAADRWGAGVLGATAAAAWWAARRAPASPAYPLVLAWGLGAVSVRARGRWPVTTALAAAAAAAATAVGLRGARAAAGA